MPTRKRETRAQARAREQRARDRQRSRIARQIANHAPVAWEQAYDREALIDAVENATPLYMFVLALDIRQSTFLMKEAVEFDFFARVLDAFVSTMRTNVRRNGGWFDKFTGDGFLAYWVVEDAPHDEYHEAFVNTMADSLAVADLARDLYDVRVLEEYRHNSRNLPAGLGVGIGLDAGPGYLVEMAGDLTIVGPPVVGAVRMVEATLVPGEILANVYYGGALEASIADKYEPFEEMGIVVERQYRPTKEYASGQEVYPISFRHGIQALRVGSEPSSAG